MNPHNSNRIRNVTREDVSTWEYSFLHTPEASIFGQPPHFTDVHFNFVQRKRVLTQQPISWHANGLRCAVWKTLIQKNWRGNWLKTYNRTSVQQNRLLQSKMEKESNHQERTRSCHTGPSSASLSCWEHCLFLRPTAASNGLAMLPSLSCFCHLFHWMDHDHKI